MSLLQHQQIAGLVVRSAVDPAAIEDADPIESERANRRGVRSTGLPLALVEGARPEAHALFRSIRTKTLEAERTKDAVLTAQYLFEEICAKTLYNMSISSAPFDPDSPY